jgi:O-antigen/teichoic acid export membrane protein
VLSVLGWLSGYGNNYVIQFFLEPVEVARFTFALTLSSIIQLVATAMNQVWNPRFYLLLNRLPIQEVEKESRRFFGLQAVVLGLVGALLIALLPQATHFLGGNLAQYESARTGLLFLVLYYLASIPWWHCNNYFMAHDQGSIIMRVALIAGLAGLAGSILLIAVLGPLGIYVGLLLQIVLRSAGLLIVAKRNWSVKTSWEGIGAGVFLTVASFVATS